MFEGRLFLVPSQSVKMGCECEAYPHIELPIYVINLVLCYKPEHNSPNGYIFTEMRYNIASLLVCCAQKSTLCMSQNITQTSEKAKKTNQKPYSPVFLLRYPRRSFDLWMTWCTSRATNSPLAIASFFLQGVIGMPCTFEAVSIYIYC